MRVVALSILAVYGLGCGGPDQPALANAPRPDPAAVAGVAAAAAAAITLASPDSQKSPEQQKVDKHPNGITVKESVPGDVLDRLESKHADDASVKQAETAKEPPKTQPAAAKKPKGPVKLPTPEEAARKQEPPATTDDLKTPEERARDRKAPRKTP